MSMVTPSPKPITGRHIFLMFFAFFAFIAAVNAVMMTLAISTLPGTVTDSAYRANQRFNGELAAARAREAAGLKVEAHVERAENGAAAVSVAVADAEARPLAGLAVEARLVRPTDRRADHALTLSRGPGGLYLGAAEGVAPGAYDLVVEARRGDDLVYRSKDRILLP